MIHQALGSRPIGLIATSWGGTPIEVWMPPKAFEDCTHTELVFNLIRFICFLRFHIEVEICRYNDMTNPSAISQVIIRVYLIQ
jgi:hypothetical protein